MLGLVLALRLLFATTLPLLDVLPQGVATLVIVATAIVLLLPASSAVFGLALLRRRWWGAVGVGALALLPILYFLWFVLAVLFTRIGVIDVVAPTPTVEVVPLALSLYSIAVVVAYRRELRTLAKRETVVAAWGQPVETPRLRPWVVGGTVLAIVAVLFVGYSAWGADEDNRLLRAALNENPVVREHVGGVYRVRSHPFWALELLEHPQRLEMLEQPLDRSPYRVEGFRGTAFVDIDWTYEVDGMTVRAVVTTGTIRAVVTTGTMWLPPGEPYDLMAAPSVHDAEGVD
jgi:hypothetical protein